MANELSKAIKQKTDSQLRLLDQDTAPVIRQTPTGDNYAVDPNEYSQSLSAGTNITINTAGNIKTINAVMGILAGDNISISEPDENGNVTITAEGGGGAIEQATETELGGVKAKAKTTETAEVVIDPATGKLFAPESGGGSDLIVYSEGGYIIEDFEDDNFVDKFNIINNIGWARVAPGNNSSYCFANGNNIDNSRQLIINIELFTAGKVSFDYYCTSTIGYDSIHYLSKIIINNAQVFSKTYQNWTRLEFELSAGLHEIKFIAYNNRTAATTGAKIDNFFIPSEGVYNMDAVANNPNSILITALDGSNIGFLPKLEIMQKLQGAILPTPTVQLRGQIFTLEGGAGVADISYICKKNASDVYTWVEI